MAMTKILGFTGEAEILGGLHAVTFHAGSGLTIQGLDLDGAYGVLDALARRQITGVRLQPGDRPPERQADDPRLAEYTRMQGEGFNGSFSDFLDYIHEHAGKGSTEAKALADVPFSLVPKPLEVDKAAFLAAGVGPGVVPAKPIALENAGQRAEQPKKSKRPPIQDVKLPEPEIPPPSPAAFAGESATDRAARGALEAGQVKEPPKEPEKVKEAPPAAGGEIPEKVLSSKRFIEVLEWVMKAYGHTPKDVDAIVAQLEQLKAQIPVVQRVRDLQDKVTSNLAAWAENGG